MKTKKQLTSKDHKQPGRFRRHILPPLAGVTVVVLVMALLNGQLLLAQWKYYTASQSAAQNQQPTANPTPSSAEQSNTASPDPSRGTLLTIPAIQVEAPIIFEPSFAEWKVQVALRDGVVHYGTTANPGQAGNMVILGHSSGQPWAPGNYKFIFTLLEKLPVGEQILVDYNGIRYTYKVTGSLVVAPNDTSVIQPTDTPTLTLITCTPVGTSKNRLAVKADLISPMPSSTAEPDKPVSPPAVTTLPASLPSSAQASLWQRFLDLFR